MATKTFKVSLSLDNPRIIQTGIKVRSFDKQSIKIAIELTKNSQVYQIPTGAQIKISLLKLARQEQKIILDVPFTSADSIDWIVPDYLDGYQGEVRVGVYLIVGTENIDVGYFNITSSVSDIDSAAEEFTESVLQGWAIEDLTALLPQFQAVLDETTGKDVISAPEIILARGGATTLGERLEEDKAEVTAQLAQTDTLLNKKVGDGVLAEMADLSQAVKEGMTGGSVAVVGEGTVTMANLANDVKPIVESIANKENIKISHKNMFNPSEVILGKYYRNDGVLATNVTYKASPKYTVSEGESVSISNMGGLSEGAFTGIRFWAGETYHSTVPMPASTISDSMTFEIPPTVTSFGFTINGNIPPKLQIEKSPKPTQYEPYVLLENGIVKEEFESVLLTSSNKNLYDGGLLKGYKIFSNSMTNTNDLNNATTKLIPVEYGKFYTISGIDSQIAPSNIVRGYKNRIDLTTGFVKNVSTFIGDKTTIYIDDPEVKFIVFNVSDALYGGNLEKAENNSIQVEEGKVATSYEPMYYIPSAEKRIKQLKTEVNKQIKYTVPKIINDFKELNKVRDGTSVVGTLKKDLSPLGMSYEVQGESLIDSTSNNLFAEYRATGSGKKEVYINIANYVNSTFSKGKLKGVPFTVPSGQLDNGELPDGFTKTFDKDNYCHPHIAYSSVPVAGYKYWMITSILPAYHEGDSKFEDEDMFVSNDAINWKRIKSVYEDEKTYTAPVLSLPPHSLAVGTARKHAFLPTPSAGDVLEMSVPADNGAVALDRVNVTLTELPWKHDPAILIDGGYVYTYHSFHLPTADRTGGKNRFIVCVRTNNGIDWDVVRSDGSTMRLTEESSKTLFTKDETGRYNYLYYAYNRGYSNPEVIKYGDNDYELVYGYNFGFRLKGTTPYSFDFTTQYPFQDVSSGNHPGLMLNGTDLYLINQKGLYVSTDRGVNFTKYPYYPSWIGGVSGNSYKKTMCVGEGGKVIYVDTQRQHSNTPNAVLEGGFSTTSDVHQLFIYIYPSITDLISKAQNGLNDGYIDVQITKTNRDKGTRSVRFYPYVSNTKSTTLVNSPLEKVKVTDLQLEEGDSVYLYVTLNSRNGAMIRFGGIEII